MKMLCHLRTVEYSIGQFLCSVLGMGRHKAYPEVALYLVQFTQKLRKSHTLIKVLSVGIDVLSQKHYLLVAVTDQSPYLIDYILRLSAALSASDIGNYAVGAEIIAAEHYRHRCLEAAVTYLRHNSGEVVILADIRREFRSVETFQQKMRQ